MCGIVGVAGTDPYLGRETLGRMRDSLTHRGPDDEGLWWSEDGRVGLGHRRLAILDLTSGGHQPMEAMEGSAQIVFNGEIYNHDELRCELRVLGHRFRSRSDTEVLLASYLQWNTRCVDRLRGMFAFAIHDPARRRLFLARDRGGEKPLFYRQNTGRIEFASEVRALLANPAAPRVLDLRSFEFYLAVGFMPNDRCAVEGIRKLPAGHAMTFDYSCGQSSIWQYWRLPSRSAGAHEVSPKDLVSRFDNLLDASVQRQLVADVPVGILLSGGIDSSLVTAVAARHSSNLRTFTVTFPDGHDEGPYARRVAQFFGTIHTELPARACTIESLSSIADGLDEPVADSSIIPTYALTKLIREHVTVALGGDGGDELFAGYTWYNWQERNRSVQRYLPSWSRSLALTFGRWLPTGFRGRNTLLALSTPYPRNLASAHTYFDETARIRLSPILRRRSCVRHEPTPEQSLTEGVRDLGSTVRDATIIDFSTFMVDGVLLKVDRASMLNSLEVRAPLLDHSIIEFAFSDVPDSVRGPGDKRKLLLRQFGERVLPPNLHLDRKQGFSPPLDDWYWLLKPLIEDTLTRAEPRLFDAQEITRLLRSQRRGRRNMRRLFAIVMFELWRRRHRIEIPEP